ncbi:MAG: family 10 glycosylhydrolase [Firmicutes bacterium]|nr:family 10 glycosylhydrolase [Bacillota bacterium]MDH7494432.1 family 10 glycosylhydrolase [Bacillota bacterium]
MEKGVVTRRRRLVLAFEAWLRAFLAFMEGTTRLAARCAGASPEHRRACSAAAVFVVGGVVCLFMRSQSNVAWMKDQEVRGLWVVRTSMATRGSVEKMVDLASKHNFNALFVQVNGRGEAYYTSSLVPRAPRVHEGFDPLEFCIQRAHEAGLQVHAWINAFTVGEIGRRTYPPGHVLSRHPEWALVDEAGVSTLDYTKDMAEGELVSPMLDPAIEGVKEYVHDVFMEVVRNYDVDGVHFDYIRYPSTRFGYGDVARSAFRDLTGFDPLDLTRGQEAVEDGAGKERETQRGELMAKWDEFRRDQVTEVVRRVYEEVKRVKPGVAVSCAVFPDAADAASRRLQDWDTWLSRGIVDFLVPMVYTSNGDVFTRHVRDAVEAAARGRARGRVLAGVGAYNMLEDPEGCVEKIRIARLLKAAGVVLFSYDAISDNPGYWQSLARGPFRDKALAPALARHVAGGAFKGAGASSSGR